MTPYRFFCAGRYRRTIHCSSQERADTIARLRYGPTGRAIPTIPVHRYHLPEQPVMRRGFPVLSVVVPVMTAEPVTESGVPGVVVPMPRRVFVLSHVRPVASSTVVPADG